MSGGSYDYLCYTEISDLPDKLPMIQQMAYRLAGLGYASDAARETEELLLTLRQFQARIETMKSRLEGVWHAIEWWDSCDYGEEQVKAELEAYRKGKQKP